MRIDFSDLSLLDEDKYFIQLENEKVRHFHLEASKKSLIIKIHVKGFTYEIPLFKFETVDSDKISKEVVYKVLDEVNSTNVKTSSDGSFYTDVDCEDSWRQRVRVVFASKDNLTLFDRITDMFHRCNIASKHQVSTFEGFEEDNSLEVSERMSGGSFGFVTG